jgi:hypothetical protein
MWQNLRRRLVLFMETTMRIFNILLAGFVVVGVALLAVFEGSYHFGFGLIFMIILAMEIATSGLALLGWGNYHLEAWSMSLRLLWLLMAGLMIWVFSDQALMLDPSLRDLGLSIGLIIILVNGPMYALHWYRYRKMTMVSDRQRSRTYFRAPR